MYFARANWYWYWYWYSISRHTRILCLIIAVVVLTYTWDKLSDLLHVRCCSAKDVYWSVQEGLGMDADPGRAGRFVYWDDFVQIARFKKLACLCHIKQNDLTYMGRFCTPCLSVSAGICGMGIAIAAWWTFSCKTDCIDIYSALDIFIVCVEISISKYPWYLDSPVWILINNNNHP